MADHFASSVVSTRKTRRHLVVQFHDKRNWGRFIPGGNAKWNRKFPEFPNFQKRGQPREVNRNFRNEFPENLCSIRFWTGISGNFGRMERAHSVSFVMHVSGAKFEEHWSNISGDILDWVLYCFGGTTYDVITFLICTMQQRKYL